jgi:hypothetical protein
MLHEEHRHAALIPDGTEDGTERCDLFVIEAAGGLVNEEELRMSGQSPRQLDARARPTAA